MAMHDDLFELYSQSYDRKKQSELTLKQFLDACRDDPMLYASASERMLAAIGEPKLIDTSKDTRLSLIHI